MLGSEHQKFWIIEVSVGLFLILGLEISIDSINTHFALLRVGEFLLVLDFKIVVWEVKSSEQNISSI